MLTLKMLTYAKYAALFLKTLLLYNFGMFNKKGCPSGQPFFIRDDRARHAGL